MSSTALGAAKKETVIFISDAHENFYYEKLKEVRYQDVYHEELRYCFGIRDDTKRKIKSIYDFKKGCVKTERLHEGRQTGESVKVVMLISIEKSDTCSCDSLAHSFLSIKNRAGFALTPVRFWFAVNLCCLFVFSNLF